MLLDWLFRTPTRAVAFSITGAVVFVVLFSMAVVSCTAMAVGL